VRSASFVALACAASLALCGCATTGTGALKARAAVNRAGDAYDRIRGRADEVLPMLPLPIATRVRVALVIADVAIGAARAATSPVDQAAELRRLAGATATILAALPAR